VPQALSNLSSEEKNRIYDMMHFHVLAQRDGTLIADRGCNDVSVPRWSPASTTPAFGFVPTNDREVELDKVWSLRAPRWINPYDVGRSTTTGNSRVTPSWYLAKFG
jgi:hypothetical protein